MTGPGPVLRWPDRQVDQSVRFEVVTMSGRATCVEVIPREEMVEIWHHHVLAGTFPRETLRRWLAGPAQPLAAQTVIFSVDRMVDRDGRVAVSFPDVQVWTIAPTVLEHIRKQV